jgi:hypothetical protein
MTPLLVSALVFVSIFAGAVVGMALRSALPDEQLGPDSKEVVRLATSLIVTMSGLVLGLLVSSASTSYQGQKNDVASLASQVIIMDHLLQTYGPETYSLRVEMRKLLKANVDRAWPQEADTKFALKPSEHGEEFYQQLQDLVPANNVQIDAKGQIMSLALTLRQNQWLMFLKSDQNAVPYVLLCVVVSWLVMTYVSFGLFAPPNATVIATLALSAVAVTAAIFIIIELYSPFTGILRISSAPVRDVLDQLPR